MIPAFSAKAEHAKTYEYKIGKLMKARARKEGHFGKLPKEWPPKTQIKAEHKEPRRKLVVDLLRKEGPMTARQIADKLGATRQHISNDLRDLSATNRASRVKNGQARNTIWSIAEGKQTDGNS